MLAYAIYREDPVFILGQALGLVIYARNIWLIRQNKQVEAASAPEVEVVVAS